MVKNTYRQLLAVAAYRLTGEQIGKLKEPLGTGFPEYCINTENGKIAYSVSYLQFVNEGNDEYVLFYVKHASPSLDCEMSDSGLESVLYYFDMRPLFDKLKYLTYDEMGKRIPAEEYIVVDITYFNSGNDDYEMEASVEGYLGEDMSFVPMKLERIKLK